MHRLDKHIGIVEVLTSLLRKKYTDCAIGITGSVARGTHNQNSDIDIVVLDKLFKRHRQCVFCYNGNVRVNLLCLNPAKLESRIEEWVMHFDGQHLNYICSAKILYDKNGLLNNLQVRLREKISLIENCDKDLFLKYHRQLQSQYSIINRQKDLGSKRSLLQKNLYLLIGLWYFSYGLKNQTKNNDRNSFNTIKSIDRVTYNLLKNIIEIKYMSMDLHIKLYQHIIKNLNKLF